MTFRADLRPAIGLVLLLQGHSVATEAPVSTDTYGLYETVRAVVFADPYETLPHYPVNRALFGASGEEPANALRAAARRTLTDDADLIEFPGQRKLFQPNGICYVGEWRVQAATGHTGLFAEGTVVPALVRISVMLGETRAGALRTLGMAVKLFPRARHDRPERSYNVLVMDKISGSRRPHVADAELDNNPEFGGLPSIASLATALRIRRDLNAVDRVLSPAGPNLRYRSLDHLARAGAQQSVAPRAPHWIRLRVAPGTPRVAADDFRDELRLHHYPGQRLVYVIEVADEVSAGKSAARWQALGRLELEGDVVSAGCDQRLHFAHPLLDH